MTARWLPAAALLLLGTLRMAAEGLGLDVEPHAPGPSRRQCMAATRNSNYYELGLVHPRVRPFHAPVYTSGYSDEIDAIDRNGHVAVPDLPGLGVTFDSFFWESDLLLDGSVRKVIERPRHELSKYAPRIETMKIHPDRIREVIGPGGKMIRQIQSESGTEIEIEDDEVIALARELLVHRRRVGHRLDLGGGGGILVAHQRIHHVG